MTVAAGCPQDATCRPAGAAPAAQDGSARPAASVPPSAANAADLMLRRALRSDHATMADCAESEWVSVIAAAVYTYGAVAVGVLRQCRDEGILRGVSLCAALEELGYIDELSSQTQRRALLVEGLRSSDSDTRHAAAQGLVFLEDGEAVDALHVAVAVERNDLVKAQMQEAVDCSLRPA